MRARPWRSSGSTRRAARPACGSRRGSRRPDICGPICSSRACCRRSNSIRACSSSPERRCGWSAEARFSRLWRCSRNRRSGGRCPPAILPRPRNPRWRRMRREIIINASPSETRIALLEDKLLVEVMVERPESVRRVGDIYKGRVNAVLPGMQAAFVDLGLEKSAFLHASDLQPDTDLDDLFEDEDETEER